MLSPNDPLWLALGSAERQDAGSWLDFLEWELSFLRWDPSSHTGPWWHNSLFTPGHERGRAELVPPISCRAAATLVRHGSCLRNRPHHLPSPLSPQGQARRTVHPVPPRPPHPNGAASPPAVRASTPPTATGCPTKSARGTLPP